MSSTVLIVDDNERYRWFTRALLSDAGYDVVGEACDGESALLTARRLRPDVLLLDIQLPGIDGFEVARRLRHEADAIKVVLISGRDQSEYGRAVVTCGARGFIAKDELSGRRLDALLAG
jgi:DNA-binding NarL/FixJ family response regulator